MFPFARHNPFFVGGPDEGEEDEGEEEVHNHALCGAGDLEPSQFWLIYCRKKEEERGRMPWNREMMTEVEETAAAERGN